MFLEKSIQKYVKEFRQKCVEPFFWKIFRIPQRNIEEISRGILERQPGLASDKIHKEMYGRVPAELTEENMQKFLSGVFIMLLREVSAGITVGVRAGIPQTISEKMYFMNFKNS